MVDFEPLYVTRGVGPVHINKFTTRIRPRAGQRLPTGEQLIALMPRFLDGQAAAVEIVPHRRHAQEATLQFRGVASVRPFLQFGLHPPIPIPNWAPQWVKDIGVPPAVRDWLIPDRHTDSVGRAHVGPHGFTVQTLRRLYETPDDAWIRTMVENVVIPMFMTVAPVTGAVMALTDWAKRKLLGEALLKPMADYAIMVNQYHFLAGRRSFVMMRDGNDWIFETAALERYSRVEYEKATDIVMGGAIDTVSPVWMRMGTAVANHYGRAVDPANPTVRRYEQRTPNDWSSAAVWQEVSRDHDVLDPRDRAR